MKCIGFYIVKPKQKPEWCSLNSNYILSVSENGLSEKFPDLKKCFWINFPKSYREEYRKYLQLNSEEFSEFCKLTENLFNEHLLTTDVRFCRFEDVLKISKYLRNTKGHRIIGVFTDPEIFYKYENEGAFETVKSGNDSSAPKKSIGFEILGCEHFEKGYFSFDSYIVNSLNKVIENKSEIKLKINNQTGLIQNTYDETKMFCNFIGGMGEPVVWTPFELFEYDV